MSSVRVWVAVGGACRSMVMMMVSMRCACRPCSMGMVMSMTMGPCCWSGQGRQPLHLSRNLNHCCGIKFHAQLFWVLLSLITTFVNPAPSYNVKICWVCLLEIMFQRDHNAFTEILGALQQHEPWSDTQIVESRMALPSHCYSLLHSTLCTIHHAVFERTFMGSVPFLRPPIGITCSFLPGPGLAKNAMFVLWNRNLHNLMITLM